MVSLLHTYLVLLIFILRPWSYSHNGRYVVLRTSLSFKCSSNNMHLSYHVYSICILNLLTNLSVIVSCNSVLNGLVYFINVLYICICDIVHREET